MKNKGTNYSEEDLRRTRVIALLFAVISAGVLFGTMIFRESSDRDFWKSDALCQGLIKLSSSQSVTDVFIRSVSWTVMPLAVLFLTGFCCVSQPAEMLLLFLRGNAIGISVSYMYSLPGLKGAAAAVLMILPHAAVTSVILVFAAREALRCSNIYLFYFAGKETDNPPQLNLYLLRFAVLAAASVLSSAADSLITFLLTDRLLVK